MVHLYCAEVSELKVGPGVYLDDPEVVVFRDHYAEIKNDDDRFAEKMAWIAYPGTPQIRVLDGDEAPAVLGAVTCAQCAAEGITKAFATDKQLNGHLLSHARRKE